MAERGGRKLNRRRDREAKEDLDYRRDLYVPASPSPAASTPTPIRTPTKPENAPPIRLAKAEPAAADPDYRRGAAPSPTVLLKAPVDPNLATSGPVMQIQHPQPHHATQQQQHTQNQSAPPVKPPAALMSPSPAQAAQPAQPALQLLPIPMKERVKFVDETYKVQLDAVMKVLCDQTDFLVIGVIGKQGVGKSTVMSQLCSTPDDYKASFDTQMRAGHETTGIDMYCTPERMILLDMQARNDPEKHVNTNEYEIECLRLGVFLFSICHVVLVVQDSPIDHPLWRFLRNVEFLKNKIPDPGYAQMPTSLPSPTPSDPSNTLLFGDKRIEFFPEIVFVVNKAPGDAFSWNSYVMLASAIETHFKWSILKMRGRVQMPPDLPCFNVESSKRPLHLYLLPREDPPNQQQHNQSLAAEEGASPFAKFARCATDPRPASFSRMSLHLRNQIFGIPKRAYPQPPSERDWFRSAEKIWTRLQSFELLRQYSQIFNETLSKRLS